MKVKELIQELSKFDEGLDIRIFCNGRDFDTIEEIDSIEISDIKDKRLFTNYCKDCKIDEERLYTDYSIENVEKIILCEKHKDLKDFVLIFMDYY